jgi:hypothetical protein
MRTLAVLVVLCLCGPVAHAQDAPPVVRQHGPSFNGQSLYPNEPGRDRYENMKEDLAIQKWLYERSKKKEDAERKAQKAKKDAKANPN